MTNDVVQLQLPLKPEYLAVLRSTTGVIAGALSFNYDEIMDLRVAVSEAFNLAIKHFVRQEQISDTNELGVLFRVRPDAIEILLTGRMGYPSHRDSGEWHESNAVLKSLMDEVEFSVQATGNTVLRIVKYRSAKTA